MTTDHRDAIGRYPLRVPATARTLCLPLAAFLLLSLFSVAPSIGGIIRPPWDLLAHMAYYGTIGVLIATGLRGLPFWLPFSLVCLAGGADELYQSILPGRVAGFDDFSADVVAAGLATWLVYRFLRA